MVKSVRFRSLELPSKISYPVIAIVSIKNSAKTNNKTFFEAFHAFSLVKHTTNDAHEAVRSIKRKEYILYSKENPSILLFIEYALLNTKYDWCGFDKYYWNPILCSVCDLSFAKIMSPNGIIFCDISSNARNYL